VLRAQCMTSVSFRSLTQYAIFYENTNITRDLYFKYFITYITRSL